MMKCVKVIGVARLLAYMVAFSEAGIIKYDKRIVNGNTATIGQFPWHVSIIGTFPTGSSLLCGGSLISNEWVLTAAHCVLGMISLKLGLGSTNLLEPQITYENITEYFIHPNYNRPVKHHDIALVRLPERIKETERIQIIELPKTSSNISYADTLGWVCGYGRYIDESQVVSRLLRWTRVQVIPNDECKRVFGERVVVDSTVCAVSVFNMGQNTCNGDSGGSLVIKEGDVYKQIGVISFAAAKHCAAGYPSGFMRIRSHLKWIYGVMVNYVEDAEFSQGGIYSPLHQQQQIKDEEYVYDDDDDDDENEGDASDGAVNH